MRPRAPCHTALCLDAAAVAQQRTADSLTNPQTGPVPISRRRCISSSHLRRGCASRSPCVSPRRRCAASARTVILGMGAKALSIPYARVELGERRTGSLSYLPVVLFTLASSPWDKVLHASTPPGPHAPSCRSVSIVMLGVAELGSSLPAFLCITNMRQPPMPSTACASTAPAPSKQRSRSSLCSRLRRLCERWVHRFVDPTPDHSVSPYRVPRLLRLL